MPRGTAPAGAHRGVGIAALGADTRDQQRQPRGQRTHPLDLGRVGGAHHQPELAVEVPVGGGQPRDVFVQQFAGGTVRPDQALPLQVGAARIRGAAQQEGALVRVAQVGLDRVQAEEGRERHRVGRITLEGLAGIVFGRAADVAALRIEDHRHPGGHAADVLDQPLELLLGAVRGEVRDLRLEGDHQVAGGVDDGGAEVEDAAGLVLPGTGEARGLRVQAHTEQGLVLSFGGGELVGEAHARILGRRCSGLGRPDQPMRPASAAAIPV